MFLVNNRDYTYFYTNFKFLLTRDSPVVTEYLKSHSDKDNFTFVFKRKIVQEKEIKLKEFNFKLLHGILPCNKNLMKWKIRMNDQCDVCQQQQTIKHLLFECIYVKPLWEIVEEICDFEITFDKILGTEECHSQDRIVTLISFLVYKQWLLFSLADKKRYNNIMLDVYKNELALRLKIYEACSCYNPYENEYINLLIDRLS